MKAQKVINILSGISVSMVSLFFLITALFLALQKYFMPLETELIVIPFQCIVYVVDVVLTLIIGIRFIKKKPQKIAPLVTGIVIITITPLIAGALYFLQTFIARANDLEAITTTLFVCLVCSKIAWLLWLGTAVLIAAAIVNIATYKTRQEN